MLRQDVITSNSEAVDMFMSLDVEVCQLAHNDAEELNTARENHSQREKQTNQFTDSGVATKQTVTKKKSLVHEKSKIKKGQVPSAAIQHAYSPGGKGMAATRQDVHLEVS